MIVAEIIKVIQGAKSSTPILDPMPTSLVKERTEVFAPLITEIVNLTVEREVSDNLKLTIITPILKN